MYGLKVTALAAVAAWAVGSSAVALPCDYLNGVCPRGANDNYKQLGERLSRNAKIYFPGSSEFERAVQRWSNVEPPKPNVVVVPGTTNDVAETVKFANNQKTPFLAFNGAHGATTTLGKMTSGIEIYLEQLAGVKVAANGKTATIGGGTNSKVVTDALWAANKQTVTGTCECVSYMGPGLGGGHGWLQGHHGLISDQWESMEIVLANGSINNINKNSDLWWAMKGAGHNFGIVTSITVKVYDIQYRDWAIETLIFSGKDVEAVYQAANDNLLKDGKQPEGIINWSYWLNNPPVDPNNPIILFWIIQEGVKTVDTKYSKPFRDIGPLVIDPQAGDYRDLAGWTGIALDSAPCQKAGLANPRFPLYLTKYDVKAQKKAWDVFSAAVAGTSPFSGSLFMFEGYSVQGVQSIDPTTGAFAYRSDNLLTAPLITYTPDPSKGKKLDQDAEKLGNQLRDILYKASGRKELNAYVNYSYGNEKTVDLYGSEKWRQDRLKDLKKKYDPQGRFSFYAPI